MRISLLLCFLFVAQFVYGQSCTGATGDQTSYGTNNQWIGYIYDSLNFKGYHGYVTEGTALSPNFNENFGGDYDSIRPISGCAVYTESFSARFKLQQNFPNNDYEIVIGGDDGFRLSVDGGNTWLIDEWSDHGFYLRNTRVHLSGITNLVLEYYEKDVSNQLSFEMYPVCDVTGSQIEYGTNNQWIGYVYSNKDFTDYRGTIGEGSPSTPSFYEDFGTSEGFATTNQCKYITETFSVRFRLRKQFAANNYAFVVGGDDGYRLSFDGGITWPIENYASHSYVTSSKTIFLNGSYDMVLEYYDEDRDNMISFELKEGSLPLKLLSFVAIKKSATQNFLSWTVSEIKIPTEFIVERSRDGHAFKTIEKLNATAATRTRSFSITDENPEAGNNFYRLMIRNATGSLYSAIRLIANKTDGRLLVFPNPVQDHVIYFNAPQTTAGLQIKLIDHAGKLVLQTNVSNISAGQILHISIPPTVAKGNYFFLCMNSNGESYEQLISID